MARYIDADKAKEFIKEYSEKFSTLSSVCEKSLIVALNVIDLTPTADAVEVVRCKDCEYLFDYSPDEKPFCELLADGYDHQFRPNPEDYCSLGQPRTPKERGE